MKVLVIDDDKFFRTLLESELRQVNAEVAIAADGEEGLEMIKTFKPDAIILDLILRKKSGFEVMEDIAKIPEGKSAAIFVYSSLSQEHDKEEALALGARAYFFKEQQTAQDVIGAICALKV